MVLPSPGEPRILIWAAVNRILVRFEAEVKPCPDSRDGRCASRVRIILPLTVTGRQHLRGNPHECVLGIVFLCSVSN